MLHKNYYVHMMTNFSNTTIYTDQIASPLRGSQ